MLYHGSPKKFKTFLSPVQGAETREPDRTRYLDRIFLSSDRDLAIGYAGREGYLYCIDCPDAVPYRQDGKKSPAGRDGIYTAKPENIKICLRLQLAHRRRNQPQDFILC